jgi:ATP-dependent Clp protease protease subunit
MSNFKVRMAGAKAGELVIYEDITPRGWGGVDAKSVMDEVKGLGRLETLNVRLNSQGGDVFEGVAIYNFLHRLDAHIVVDIDAQALSIASVIAMAGDEIRIAENARVMIHDPWTIVMGTADEFRKRASVMDDVKESMLGIYAARTKRSTQELASMMTDETWFSASEAIEFGFADKMTENLRIAAKFDPKRFKNAPAIKPTADEVPPNVFRARLAAMASRTTSYAKKA